MTNKEIAMVVFVTEQESGLHTGLTFNQWYASKTEGQEVETVQETTETIVTFVEWLKDFEAKHITNGAVLKVDNKKAQSMLNLKIKEVTYNEPRIVAGRQEGKIPWVELENGHTFRIRPLQTGSWKVVNL